MLQLLKIPHIDYPTEWAKNSIYVYLINIFSIIRYVFNDDIRYYTPFSWYRHYTVWFSYTLASITISYDQTTPRGIR